MGTGCFVVKEFGKRRERSRVSSSWATENCNQQIAEYHQLLSVFMSQARGAENYWSLYYKVVAIMRLYDRCSLDQQFFKGFISNTVGNHILRCNFIYTLSCNWKWIWPHWLTCSDGCSILLLKYQKRYLSFWNLVCSKLIPCCVTYSFLKFLKNKV